MRRGRGGYCGQLRRWRLARIFVEPQQLRKLTGGRPGGARRHAWGGFCGGRWERECVAAATQRYHWQRRRQSHGKCAAVALAAPICGRRCKRWRRGRVVAAIAVVDFKGRSKPAVRSDTGRGPDAPDAAGSTSPRDGAAAAAAGWRGLERRAVAPAVSSLVVCAVAPPVSRLAASLGEPLDDRLGNN